ncbi:MAG TPA: copper resistance protein NlpE [Candidatus Paceibacterota bacterium]
MKHTQLIALGAFVALALLAFAFIPPPASLTESPREEGVLLGTFTGVTACADCPGIDTRLTLREDGPYSARGTYELTLIYRESNVAPYRETGTWTTERGTPANPDAVVYALYAEGAETPQRYERVDAGTIRLLDADGNPLDASLGFTLTRETAREAALPEERTLLGAQTCLPHRDTTGPQTLECAIGFLADDGSYYALDLARLDEAQGALLMSGVRVEATGTVTPSMLLSTDQWTRYQMEGVFSVTEVRAL